MRRISTSSRAILCAVSITLYLPNLAQAAGFELLEQSETGVGQAFAGTATGFGDGSEVYFNPASMTYLGKDTFSAGVSLIRPQAQFDNRNSRYASQLGGGPLTGNNGGDAADLETVPNAYAVVFPTEYLALGFGVNSPFGLESKYNDTWIGRYQAIDSRLTTVDLVPAVAVRLGEMFSIGGNLRVMYGDARLSNDIDYGAIGLAQLGPQTAIPLGLTPGSADGLAVVKGDDWGVGYGLGATFTPIDELKFGLNFRSKLDLRLSGDAEFDVPQAARPLTQTGLFQDSHASAGVTLPEQINVGAAWSPCPEFTLFADYAWTKWDRFNELRVNFSSPQPDSVQEEKWDNVSRISLGARFQYWENWVLRTGFTWDESPVSGSAYRTPRIPDNDRYWLAVGAQYLFDQTWSAGVNYAHIFIPSAFSSVSSPTGSVLDGKWDMSIKIVSFNVVAQF